MFQQKWTWSQILIRIVRGSPRCERYGAALKMVTGQGGAWAALPCHLYHCHLIAVINYSYSLITFLWRRWRGVIVLESLLHKSAPFLLLLHTRHFPNTIMYTIEYSMICTAPSRFAFINILYDYNINSQHFRSRLVTVGSQCGHLGWCIGCFTAPSMQLNFCKCKKPNIFLSKLHQIKTIRHKTGKLKCFWARTLNPSALALKSWKYQI